MRIVGKTRSSGWLGLLFSAALLAACQAGNKPASQPLTTSQAAANPAASQSALSYAYDDVEQEFITAIDILLDRGFEPNKIRDFIGITGSNSECAQFCPHYEMVQRYLVEKSGQSLEEMWQNSSPIGGFLYDIRNGQKIDRSDAVATAKAISSCYGKGNVWEECHPKYHPLQGCRLNAEWRNFCAKELSLDGCWDGAKADLVIAPPTKSSQMSRIQLASAVRVDAAPNTPAASAAPATPKQQAKSAKKAPAKADYCRPLWQ
ncbi:hypothetical protein HDIA_1016 [Hartmannibacter diazotrophicus]|uniref:Lipoprotein n=1 Tax=Hartmannibacter diazotrophicus TaxID=1482074 RepID=A0A2C9D2J4_9HYPH|nr:hypothetical protein [Hartmannibacter diazotrophicus]SON54557.1 hypothetical protein HDIA_1016 [Hartmannibacter diazotrophicus]